MLDTRKDEKRQEDTVSSCYNSRVSSDTKQNSLKNKSRITKKKIMFYCLSSKSLLLFLCIKNNLLMRRASCILLLSFFLKCMKRRKYLKEKGKRSCGFISFPSFIFCWSLLYSISFSLLFFRSKRERETEKEREAKTSSLQA